ncbi:MAG: hypothetical protein AB7I18_03130 [Candidatus Berkiella sp.]
MKDERRRYFRIEDEVIFAWHPLTQAEKEKGLERFNRGEIHYPDTAGLFLSMEADIVDSLQSIYAKQPDIAEILELLNRKINLFARGMSTDQSMHTLLDERPQAVSLSASGMSFESPIAASQGDDIQLEIVLLPEKVYILCFAKVIDCVDLSQEFPEKTGLFRLNADFQTIRDDDTERLVQHIMRKEVEFLRARRISRQND